MKVTELKTRPSCSSFNYARNDSSKHILGPKKQPLLQSNAIMIDASLRLRRAILTNDSLLVHRILTSHPHLVHNPDTSVSGLSNTSLHLACSLGHLPIVKVLVLQHHHESPSISLNEDHQTALMLAAATGYTEIVHFLCTETPRSIPKQDIRGRDAIMIASLGGHDTVLQILLTYAPDGPEALLDHCDLEGNTALHFASSNGNLLALRTLLAAGADSERRNVWSWTPVSYSATVSAEVYFKALVGEVVRRREVRREIVEKGCLAWLFKSLRDFPQKLAHLMS
ncbi:hypothetical protein B7494_g5165 [Chlorociboria aeruginascens]|nr:hypothetical protein B7494_g5165 [Chlorociboria aeruginascens]